MASKLIQISVGEEFIGEINAIKKAFEKQGYKNMFSSFVVNSAISSFCTKNWGEFLSSNRKRVYTTEEILNSKFRKKEKWIKAIGNIK